MTVVCACNATERQCDSCVDLLYWQIVGVALGRGDRWAASVWERATAEQRASPWPKTPKAHQQARERLRNLSVNDERLLARLTEAVSCGAAQRWERLRTLRN